MLHDQTEQSKTPRAEVPNNWDASWGPKLAIKFYEMDPWCRELRKVQAEKYVD